MKPIIFGGDMVRAILEGRKTQTRRAVIPSPPEGWRPKVGLFHPTIARRGVERPGPEVFGASDEEFGVKCPYGQPGDRLWVRETWCQRSEDGYVVYNAEGNLDPSCCWYAADGVHVRKCDGDGFAEYRKDGSEASPWRPSIHMPRWASRITLEITAISLDRLQDISEADARAEGAQCPGFPAAMTDAGAFAKRWEMIHGKGAWAVNPWVWVVEFRKVGP